MNTLPLLGGDLLAVLQRLGTEPAVLVVVERTEGSVPRERGAWMAVFAHDALGTIGGGHLEWLAMREARARLAQADGSAGALRCPLGPALGQCCGGVVHLVLEPVARADAAALRQRWHSGHTPVALFGGGHVGRALVAALAPLPFALRWVDSRDEIFPPTLPANVCAEHSDPVHRAVADLAPGSRVLIMSFSHAEDLDIVDACLQRQAAQGDLPFVGLIGSQTKWATFRRRLEARGHSAQAVAHITCPIGLPTITGKQPEVIAASVAAQLLGLGRSD
jgi:xanthine dehydrogenase accessory factor